jgi:hypothetical protein
MNPETIIKILAQNMQTVKMHTLEFHIKSYILCHTHTPIMLEKHISFQKKTVYKIQTQKC